MATRQSRPHQSEIALDVPDPHVRQNAVGDGVRWQAVAFHTHALKHGPQDGDVGAKGLRYSPAG